MKSYTLCGMQPLSCVHQGAMNRLKNCLRELVRKAGTEGGNSLTMVFLKKSIRGCFLLHHLILARTDLLSEEEHVLIFKK